MKIVFCIFSYAPDEKLCELAFGSIKRLQRLYPEHEIVTALINDGNNPIQDPESIGFDIIKTTVWPRGGSLAGSISVRGQSSTYWTLFKETGADLLIKLDSDTLIMDLEWLSVFDKFNAGMWGTTSDCYPCIFGACYGIRPETSDAFEYLLARSKLKDLGEDIVFTRLAEIASDLGMCGRVATEFYRRENVDGVVNQVFIPHPTDKDSPNIKFKDVCSRTFKMRGQDSDAVLPEMRRVWEEIKNTPRGSINSKH